MCSKRKTESDRQEHCLQLNHLKITELLRWLKLKCRAFFTKDARNPKDLYVDNLVLRFAYTGNETVDIFRTP